MYSTAFAHAGAYSMLTGIPTGGVAVQSFSEIFTDATVPADITDVNLSFWIYTTSGAVATTGPVPLAPVDPPFRILTRPTSM